MTTLPVVLVAVDGSDACMHAITYISRIISPHQADIELFHVHAEAPDSVFDLGGAEGSIAYEEEIGNWMDQEGNQMHDFMDNARKVFMEAGFPPDAVKATIQPRKLGTARDIIAASELDCCAVVIGRKCDSSLPDFMLGGIAAKMAESDTRVPLVVVGGRPEPGKVLVAFDRSRSIRRGFEKISRLFTKSLREILLCHVIRPLSVPHPVTCTYFSTRTEAHWLDQQSQRIRPTMIEMKKHLSSIGFGPKILRTVILQDKISRADAVANEAEAQGFGTIVVGRHGATAVDEFTMGRVTRKILSLSFNKAIWIV
jgi:nucleotide-binding universal stress UspA family protein